MNETLFIDYLIRLDLKLTRHELERTYLLKLTHLEEYYISELYKTVVRNCYINNKASSDYIDEIFCFLCLQQKYIGSQS